MSNDSEDQTMADTSANTAPTAAFIPFTKAERIQQLCDIDKSIAQLVHSAGLALKTLTLTRKAETTTSTQTPQEAFTEAAQDWLDSLQSISVRMKRSVTGLKEAGIIPETRKDDDEETQQNRLAPKDRKGTRINLDVGLLNSRSRKVDTDMEREIWAQAREFVERIDERGFDGRGGGGIEGDAMQT